MNGIIVYGSCYGSSERYAAELAKRLGVEAVSYEKATGIQKYDTVIYIGGLYAGGVRGLKETFRRSGDISGKKLIIATVGMSDPNDGDNINNIRSALKRQLPGEIYEKAALFHLRGAIDYSKMGFAHKTLMKMLVSKCRNIPENERTPDTAALIETYGQTVDYVAFSGLDPIVQAIFAH